MKRPYNRSVGLTKDVGFQIGVRRTLPIQEERRVHYATVLDALEHLILTEVEK